MNTQSRMNDAAISIETNNETFAYVMSLHERMHRKNTLGVNHALLRQLTDFHGKELKIQDITELFCRNFTRFLCDKVSTTSARTYLNKLHAVLQQAVSCCLIASNPMPPARELVPRAKASQRTYLSNDEVVALERTPCRHHETKRAFLFACHTGLRLSDIETLRWDDVSMVDGIPTIVKMQIKTGGEVRIPLNRTAQQLLGNPDGNILVFNMMSRSVIHSDLRQWALDAGIGKPLSFHVSRHTFATLSIAAGVDIYVVSKLCGHTSVRTTEIYAHMVDKTLQLGVTTLCDNLEKSRVENTTENKEKTIAFHGVRWIIEKLFRRNKSA